MFGIKFAPWRVPLERRLQTGAVLFYTLLFIVAPLLTCLLFVVFLFTPLAPIAIAYGSWIIFDYSYRQTSSRGGGNRRWEAVRRAKIWRHFVNYFPAHLVKTTDLDPAGNYLIGYHPHGLIGCGAFASFGCEGTGFSKVYPGITPHLLTLKPNFRWPLLRGLLLWCGVCDVSKESIEWILTKKGSGNAAIIVVGGAEEALEARPGSYCLTLQRRKGFIKMAIKTGASLVPVFCFGENDLFVQADNPMGSGLRKFQEKFKHIFGISPPLFHGRGVFNYTFGVIPYRKPIYTVVGKPIPVVQSSNPEQETIDEIHKKYMDGLSDLFDQHKAKYGVDTSVKLKFT